MHTYNRNNMYVHIYIYQACQASKKPAKPEPWSVSNRTGVHGFWGLGVLGFWSGLYAFLGGSWVVTSGVISRVTILITHVRGLITPYNYP